MYRSVLVWMGIAAWVCSTPGRNPHLSINFHKILYYLLPIPNEFQFGIGREQLAPSI